jgi:hypothetical protein
VDPETYKRFAKYRLSDLAERRDRKGKRLLRGQRREEIVAGKKQRIPLRSHHISYGGVDRFRGSDLGLRLDQALRALKRYHLASTGKVRGATWNAAIQMAELIQGSKCEALKLKLLGRCHVRNEKLTPVANPKRAPLPKHVITEIRDRRFAELDEEIEEMPRPGNLWVTEPLRADLG